MTRATAPVTPVAWYTKLDAQCDKLRDGRRSTVDNTAAIDVRGQGEFFDVQCLRQSSVEKCAHFGGVRPGYYVSGA